MMIFNDIDLSNYGFIVNKNNGINIMSGIDFDIFESFNGTKKRTYARKNRRSISVKGGIKSTDLRTSASQLAQVLDPSDLTDKKILFDNDTKYYMGYCESTSLGREKTRFAEDANLVFNCDPYRYGDNISETDVNGQSLTNAGTAACFGVLSFTLTEETSFEVTLNGTTGYIGIISAPAGDYEINLKTRKLYKDGVLANTYFDAVNTIFERFVIEPGAYQIDVSESIAVDYGYTETFL